MHKILFFEINNNNNQKNLKRKIKNKSFLILLKNNFIKINNEKNRGVIKKNYIVR